MTRTTQSAEVEQGHGHAAVGHIVPPRVLITVGLGLLILTWITVAVAQVPLGRLNLVVAMLIASIKASLVVLYFMHLRYDRPFNAIVFVSALVFVAVFIIITLLDTIAYSPVVDWREAPFYSQR